MNLRTALVILAVLSGTGAAVLGGAAPPLGLREKYSLIEKDLNAFDKDTNYHHLVRVSRLQRSITETNAEMGRYMLDIRLRVIAGCDQIRDKGFDFKTVKRATTVVMPPIVPGEALMAGMDPGQIKDLAARKKYEADIAENARVAERMDRELLLQRTREDCLFEIGAYLQSIRNMKEEMNIEHAQRSINKYIKDKALAESLLKKLNRL